MHQYFSLCFCQKKKGKVPNIEPLPCTRKSRVCWKIRRHSWSRAIMPTGLREPGSDVGSTLRVGTWQTGQLSSRGVLRRLDMATADKYSGAQGSSPLFLVPFRRTKTPVPRASPAEPPEPCTRSRTTRPPCTRGRSPPRRRASR
jgi:hypothetical protein